MPNQILQVDENMLETKLDRLVSEKVEQLLNAMLDAEADEITGACRRSYTLECKTNAARRALEGEPLARVARDAGCTPTSVYQWMRRYRSEGILGLMDRRNAPMPAEPMPAAGDDVEELRRQVEVLRLENAVMRETIDVLKADDPRLDPSMLTNRERTRVVDAIRGEFGLAACLKAVGLKRSTYYYERGAIAAGDRYAVLRARVAGLFEQGGRAWGYRTIHRMLRLDESDPIVVSEKVVRRIMREGAMRPVYLKRPKRWSSYAGEIGEAPANLVERDFHADAPNMLWVTDVTQFTMDGYKCWLSPVVDCFDGMVVSWTLSRSPNADMANRMLLDAVATLRDGEHPIIHSDRGCHYRWDEWIRICEEHGLIRSMSAKGCSPDNAAAEGFFGRLKNELFYGRDWRGVGYEEFRERLAAYLTHYNETRIKKSLDWMSPVQYRKHPHPLRAIMDDALRLRHRMIPYLHTMNWRASRTGLPLVEPMYWGSPDIDAAYHVPNEYMFGTELLAAPITEPMDKSSRRGKADVWLPQGDWFDFFTGRRYSASSPNGRRMTVWRPLDGIPVFAKAGGIVPMQPLSEGDSINSVDNPQHLEIIVFPGADGDFTLMEDSGHYSRQITPATTAITYRWRKDGATSALTVSPAQGDVHALPARRTWDFLFRGITDSDISVQADGASVDSDRRYDAETLTLQVTVADVSTRSEIRVTIGDTTMAADPRMEDVFDILRHAEMRYLTKEQAYAAIAENGIDALATMDSLEHVSGPDMEDCSDSHMPSAVRQALTEVLLRS